MANPGDPWNTVPYDGRVARVIYRTRVRCDDNYYGNKCNKLCVPRNDYFGHYRCDQGGNQVCLDGWMGPNCKTGELPASERDKRRPIVWPAVTGENLYLVAQLVALAMFPRTCCYRFPFVLIRCLIPVWQSYRETKLTLAFKYASSTCLTATNLTQRLLDL